MIRTIAATGLALSVSALAFASIPPPAQPPENLPETIAGQPGSEVWYRFSEWARFEMVRQVDQHALESVPSRWSRSGAEPVLNRLGVSIRFGSTYQDSTSIGRFEHMCAGSGADEQCHWQYRRISAPHLDVMDGISRDVFDAARIEAFLAGADDTYLATGGSRDFGEADILRARLREAVIERVVTEAECPAVRERAEETERLDPVSLDMSGELGQTLLTFDEPLPPPMPPFGASFTFTFPLEAYDDVIGEVVIGGGGTPEMMALSDRLQGGLRDCFED